MGSIGAALIDHSHNTDHSKQRQQHGKLTEQNFYTDIYPGERHQQYRNKQVHYLRHKVGTYERATAAPLGVEKNAYDSIQT